MGRFGRVALGALLACSLVPGAAFALPGDGALPEQAAEDAAENGSWYAGGAIERMLAAGDYAEGRVLVRATGEFAPLSPYSNDVSAWSSSDLYAFGGDAGADARLRSAATEPDRVLLIQSETLSTEELLASLVGVPGVLAAQPDYVHVIEQPEPSSAEARAGEATGDAAPPTAPSANATAPDPFIDEQWQLASTDDVEGGTNARALWERLGYPGTALEETVVAVVDDGVDYTHPDLAGAMWENPGTLDLPGRHGYDFANDDDDPMPAGEHGTHVAGIAAAVANNGIGGAGVAPNAKIMAFRIADENGGLWESAAISAYAYMKQAVQGGVNLVAVNNSWGAPNFVGLFGDVMDDLYRNEGVLSVCATGNSGIDHDLASDSPSGAVSQGSIAVNAISSDGTLTNFSDFGAAATDIAAPGSGILSTVPPAYGVCDLDNAEDIVVQDGFEADPVLFEFETAGDATATLGLGAFGQAPNRGLLWNVTGATAGQEASIVSAPVDAKALFEAAGKTVADARYLAFDAGVTDSKASDTARIMHVYLSSTDTDEPWIELESGHDLTVPYGAGGAFAAPISEKTADKVDWENLSIKITRKLVAFDEGLDLAFTIDAMSFMSKTHPYKTLDGTSMAAPAVTGAVGLLSGAFPDESAAEIRARILGGAVQAEALTGTCTTDGRLDLVKSATDPRPVVDELQMLASHVGEGAQAEVLGSWFGEEPGSVWLDDQELSVAQWGAERVVVEFPDRLTAEYRYVKVERADGQSGRHLLVVGDAEGSGQPSDAFYESLPAPDLEQLGLEEASSVETPWQIVSAAGKLYALGAHYGEEIDGQGYARMLVFDSKESAWSIEHSFDGVPLDLFAMGASDNSIYLLMNTSRLLYRFDASMGVLDEPIDCTASFEAAGATSFLVGCGASAFDGKALWLGGSLDGSTGDSTSDVLQVDVRTGEVRRGPALLQARMVATAQWVGDSLVVAAGRSNPSEDRLADTLEMGDGSSWAAVDLPAGIERNQGGTVASGILPGGTSLPGVSSTDGPRLILAGLSGKQSAGPDTYVFDPATGAWSAASTRLAPTKVVYGAGAVLDDGFYVLGQDTVAGATVFKRLALTKASEPADPDGPGNSGGGKPAPAPGDGGQSAKPSALASTGDSALPFAVGVIALGAAAACLTAAASGRTLSRTRPTSTRAGRRRDRS